MHYGIYGTGDPEKLMQELQRKRVWVRVRPMEMYEELTV
jgi:hypothetical protein